MIRFLFYSLLVYLGYLAVRQFLKTQPKQDDVKGESQNEPLDLSKRDVEDAHFEEIKEKDH